MEGFNNKPLPLIATGEMDFAACQTPQATIDSIKEPSIVDSRSSCLLSSASRLNSTCLQSRECGSMNQIVGHHERSSRI
jgi:hypothetical protein